MDPKTVVRLLTLAAEGMLAETGAYTPEEINRAGKSTTFGLDKLQYGSIMGFYGTECGNILGLGGAFYAALTAMGLLAGEEGGHTAEFLLTHPISRLRVCLEKLAALAVLIVGLNLVCFVCGAGGILAIGEEADWGGLLR